MGLSCTTWTSSLQIRDSSETPNLMGIILFEDGHKLPREMLDGLMCLGYLKPGVGISVNFQAAAHIGSSTWGGRVEALLTVVPAPQGRGVQRDWKVALSGLLNG